MLSLSMSLDPILTAKPTMAFAAIAASLIPSFAAWRSPAANDVSGLDARMLRDIGLLPHERRGDLASTFWRA